MLRRGLSSFNVDTTAMKDYYAAAIRSNKRSLSGQEQLNASKKLKIKKETDQVTRPAVARVDRLKPLNPLLVGGKKGSGKASTKGDALTGPKMLYSIEVIMDRW